MTRQHLLLSIKDKRTEEPLSMITGVSYLVLLFPLVIQIWRRERRKRFRSKSDAMCHMENKQEGNLSRREESGFLRI